MKNMETRILSLNFRSKTFPWQEEFCKRHKCTFQITSKSKQKSLAFFGYKLSSHFRMGIFKFPPSTCADHFALSVPLEKFIQNLLMKIYLLHWARFASLQCAMGRSKHHRTNFLNIAVFRPPELFQLRYYHSSYKLARSLRADLYNDCHF